MSRGRRARILPHLHIQREKIVPREASWSAFWLQKPSILRVCVREEDAGGREAGAPSDLKMGPVRNPVLYPRAETMCGTLDDMELQQKLLYFESHNPYVPIFPACLQISPYLQICRSVSPDLHICIVTLPLLRVPMRVPV